jgi:hypothetical protein
VFRVRTQMLVKYGHYNDVLQNHRQLNEICRLNGWTESRHWCGVSGQDNTFVVETDYPNMAAYERDLDAGYADPAYMKVFRANIDHIVEGTVRTEMFLEADTIA